MRHAVDEMAFPTTEERRRLLEYDARICICGHRYGQHTFRGQADPRGFSPCDKCDCRRRERP